MKGTLTILLLEDNADDAELVRAYLANDGIACNLVRVETQTAFTEALHQNRFDLVISDYSLPQFDGLSALAIARQTAPQTPFILVSGVMGEELAVETLKRRRYRLCPQESPAAVGSSGPPRRFRSGERAARKEAERQLRQSQAEDVEAEMTLLEAWPDAMVLVGADGKIRRINRQFEVVFGYSRDEVVGKSLGMLLPERFRAAHVQHMSRYASQPEVRRMGKEKDFVGLRKDGQEFPLAIALSPVTTKRGQFFIATIRDITDAIKIRQELVDHAKELARANEELRKEHAERQKVEAELRLAQKLEAIGQLAAGIAHEINTPIQFIGDSVHFLRQAFDGLMRLLEEYEALGDSIPLAPETAAKVAEVEADIDPEYLRSRMPRAFDRTIEGIERVTAIVRAMKDFSHPSANLKSPTDLNRALESALVVSRNEYKYVADVAAQISPHLSDEGSGIPGNNRIRLCFSETIY